MALVAISQQLFYSISWLTAYITFRATTSSYYHNISVKVPYTHAQARAHTRAHTQKTILEVSDER